MNLLAELKRRNVIRMAGLYLVGAWLIVQVGETLLPLYDTPAWVMKTLIALLAMGFVPAVVFSWLYELTPDGLKRDSGMLADNPVALRTARRLDRPLHYFSISRFARALQIPGLILHDEADPVAPVAGARRIHRYWEQSELKIFTGLDHSLRDDAVWETTLDWLAANQL